MNLESVCRSHSNASIDYGIQCSAAELDDRFPVKDKPRTLTHYSADGSRNHALGSSARSGRSAPR